LRLGGSKSMPRARIVCMGWVDSATGDRHPCGKFLGYTETPDGQDSHGVCVDCFRRHLAAGGFTPEQIDQMLRDAGYTE
jgi:hypothetical protein